MRERTGFKRLRGRARLGERVLGLLSREAMEREAGPQGAGALDGALGLLQEKIPRFEERARGRAVVDFGCGAGAQAVALARGGAAKVLGVDTDLRALEAARALARQHKVEDRVTFVPEARPEDEGAFDLVLSQNSMEHFPEPERILRLMLALVRPGGELLITFGPPWFAPYGSHMRFFTPVPWVNLLFSEETVMAVRARFRDDGARRYTEVRNGLNKMTVARFERLMAGLPGEVTYRRYDGVWGADPLCALPVARELFVNHITCVFARR
jgi:SAM-dependent methyltransferase